MAYEERRVVADPGVAPADTPVVETTPAVETVPERVVTTEPSTVVERRPATTIVSGQGDPIANAWAANQMIQTVVWSVVVLVLLAVLLLALHVYAHLF